MLEKIVDLIILTAAFLGAVYKIWDFFAKPTSKLKQKRLDKERGRIIAILDEVLPEKLKEHDLQTRDKYKADRQQYLLDIKEEVIKALGGSVSQNTEDLEALKISARDVLREKIMAIYHKNKQSRTMSEYGRMAKWQVVYDEETDDDEE